MEIIIALIATFFSLILPGVAYNLGKKKKEDEIKITNFREEMKSAKEYKQRQINRDNDSDADRRKWLHDYRTRNK